MPSDLSHGSNTLNNQQLVIGLGPLGRRVVEELRTRGIPVVAASRNRVEGLGAEWRQLDASDAEQVRAVAADCEVVHLCAAPPLTSWVEEFDALVGGLLDGLRDSGKTLVFASNLYAYGPQQGTLTEASPELATGPKGALRKRLDRRVLDAPGLRTAVVRGASFYGPGVETSMAGRSELAALAAGKPVPALGSVDQPHTMTYIDDFARAMVNVASSDSALGQVWHAPMQEPTTHRELMTAFGEVLGAQPKFRIAGPAVMNLMSLFNPTMKALKETFYTYTSPHVADSSKYAAAFGEAATPLKEAVTLTVQSAGLASSGRS
ncbi:NAD-dependent epimerase/dehydratase family protein [Motilibacter aurantiacus]|uniref:NAD-dependent epimerase/dehydratase family protein n=1 Tax=Motilibacter aurantiacus TaxID=2714955 RepID=UPI00140A9214|nr:NAD-dependent epimerase/dehydratase family protein [Motilibacter aurantiacus]NHC44335.1 NAD-dependent epimerase/dehydratase family protein [Motilibacter aurantiacus]